MCFANLQPGIRDRHVAASGIAELRALLDQQVADPEQKVENSLRFGLHLHEPHGRPLCRFANGFGIRSIFLNVASRTVVRQRALTAGHHGLASPVHAPTDARMRKLPGPSVRQLGCDERQELRPVDLFAEHRAPWCVGALNLDIRNCETAPEDANSRHGRLLTPGVQTSPLWHIDAVGVFVLDS